jgi:cytochrome c5
MFQKNLFSKTNLLNNFELIEPFKPFIMKHTKSIFAIAFTAIIILTACSHKSTPTTAVAPKEAPAQFNMMSAAAPSVVEGEKVYTAKCGQCHDLKKPSEYNAKEWTSIMKSMAVKAKLNDVEKSDVMAYVANGAKVK